MSNGLDAIARIIKKDFLLNDKDYHILVFGGEGTGKSNWAFCMASMVSAIFGVKNVCFDRQGFMKLVNTLNSGSVIIGDEGANIIAKSDTLKPEQKQVVKKITMMRKLNLCIIFCMSDPNMLHNYYVRHRLSEKGIAVVRVTSRGEFIWYSNINGALTIMRSRLLKQGQTFSWSDIKGKGLRGKFWCYEAKHPKFSEEYRKRNREAITGISIEEGPKGFTKGEVIEMFLINTELSNYRIAQVVGCSSSYVREKNRELKEIMKR